MQSSKLHREESGGYVWIMDVHYGCRVELGRKDETISKLIDIIERLTMEKENEKRT